MDSTMAAPACLTRVYGWMATRKTLILDPIHFGLGKVFRIHGASERRFIALGNPMERSEGWTRVAFEPVNS